MGLDAFFEAREKKDINGEAAFGIAYFRKHPNLQGWMEAKWREVNPHSVLNTEFNGIDFELNETLIDQLYSDTVKNRLPSTAGFFFGSDSDDYYAESLLDALQDCKKALRKGYAVVYYASY